jgi:cytochrome c
LPETNNNMKTTKQNMKKICLATLLASVLAAQAQEKSISGIVAARLVQPDGSTSAFVLVDPAKPTETVTAAGADADALVPRNEITLSGSPAETPLGGGLKVTAGSVKVGETNQPFKSQPITAAAFKDASASAGNYVQLAGVTFVADKFDASGSAQVKAEDGTVVSLLVSKGAAGRETPKGVTDIFGVVVKSGGEWKLVAARFLPANRKEMLALAASATCVTCHNPDTKIVGPSFRDVAAAYRNDPGATDKLIAQMQNGGVNKWGVAPMPSLKATVPLENMQKLAAWILGYKWDAILAE